MQKTTPCLLCGAAATLKTNKLIGYQKPDKFTIYHCPDCNTSFSAPRVDTAATYNLIYSKGKDVTGYARYWRYKEAVKAHPNPLQVLHEAEESYWAPITTLKNIVTDKQNAKILEVGCGMGYLTYSLIKDGYNATGLDISQEAVDEATKHFGKHYICADIFEYAEQHKEEYDVVIMTEVIEHVESPQSFIKQAFSMLQRGGGGVIIVTTPNKTIFPDKVAWVTDLPPVHCWWFSEKSLKFIADKMRCSVEFTDFSDYYKKKPKALYLTQDYLEYRFKENGEVVKEKNPLSFIDKLRYLFFRSDIIENGKYTFFEKFVCLFLSSKIYKKCKSYIHPKFKYRCRERGTITCAVYKKI